MVIRVEMLKQGNCLHRTQRINTGLPQIPHFGVLCVSFGKDNRYVALHLTMFSQKKSIFQNRTCLKVVPLTLSLLEL